MLKFNFKTLGLAAFASALMIFTNDLSLEAANPTYVNEATGYVAEIDDEADLLSDKEERELLDTMAITTKWGNVCFKSVDYNYTSAESYARSVSKEKYGNSSNSVFLIDMDNRMIYIFSDGAIYKTITKSYANTITDNVYRYASSGDYFSCANKAFEQENKLLAGQRIAQPMKYICNALLAMIVSLIATFIYAINVSSTKKAKDEEIVNNIEKKLNLDTPTIQFVRETKHYNPDTSSSGGGGGGGGGGGSSGGGGGHSF